MAHSRPVHIGREKPLFALFILLLILPGCPDGNPPENTEISRLEVYDPALDEWQTMTHMVEPRSTAAAAVIEGKLYVVGGRDMKRGIGSMNVLEIYDPATDSWTHGANMPTKRWGPAAVNFKDELWVMGGALAFDIYYDIVEIYNPATDSWRTGEAMDVGRYRPTVGVINGRIFVAGGMSAGGTDVDAFEIWDPTYNQWLTTDDMPVARGQAAYGVWGDTLYVAGGFRWLSATEKETLDRFDTYSDGIGWRTGLADMLLARGETASGMINGKLYVVGGITETEESMVFHDRLDIYDVATDTWTTGAPSDTLRAEAAAGVINGKLYVVGGYNRKW